MYNFRVTPLQTAARLNNGQLKICKMYNKIILFQFYDTPFHKSVQNSHLQVRLNDYESKLCKVLALVTFAASFQAVKVFCVNCPKL